MITGELKSKVDKIWDTMWAGGGSQSDAAAGPFYRNGDRPINFARRDG